MVLSAEEDDEVQGAPPPEAAEPSKNPRESLLRKRTSAGAGFSSRTLGNKSAAEDLDDPDLEDASGFEIKVKASEKVNQLIDSLEAGSFGAANFDVEFRKVWPYAQGHFGYVEDPKVDSFPDLIRSVANHPLARQHGEFTL